MSDAEIRVLDDPSGELARFLVEAVRAGRSIGLSGGSAPIRGYELAAAEQPDWSAAEVWLVDARCVPHDDERSNARLVQEAILDRLERPPRAVHFVDGNVEPEEAAARYDAELEGARFELCVMGIGPDGHTASLFPGGPELDERERRAVASEARIEPFVPRVTATIPFLAESDLMVYVITGADKADAVRRSFAEEPSPDTPGSLVRGRRTVVLLDPGAASGLHP